jgi:hypothetical protein
MNIFHWSLIAISVLALINNISPTRKNNKIFVSIVTLILLAISGFRDTTVGSDLAVYYKQFMEISTLNSLAEVLASQKNFGYALFNWGFIKVFGPNYQLFLFIIAAISTLSLGYTIYRYSPAPYVSFLLYLSLGFYDFTFSGLKQTLALAFVILSYKYIYERKQINFILIVALGATFHLSAFVFLPVYYIAHKKWSAKYAGFMLLAYLFVLMLRGQIVEFLAEMYKETPVVYIADGFIGGKAIAIIMLLILGVFLNKKNGLVDSVKYTTLFNIMLLAFAIQSLSIYSHNFTRLNFFYFQFAIFYIPVLIENFSVHSNRLHLKKVNEKNVAKIILAMLAIINFLNYINGDIPPHGILPYKTFWN